MLTLGVVSGHSFNTTTLNSDGIYGVVVSGDIPQCIVVERPDWLLTCLERLPLVISLDCV